ncbi:hypothetical protein WM02_15510 [Burkholderia ubonensis]|nr:hypothetical protein WL17_01885 [Burkholderia ubonensis]KWI12572.1 hypothetical protein WM02_15510 [Burkholderia ubonensis]
MLSLPEVETVVPVAVRFDPVPMAYKPYAFCPEVVTEPSCSMIVLLSLASMPCDQFPEVVTAVLSSAAIALPNSAWMAGDCDPVVATELSPSLTLPPYET